MATSRIFELYEIIRNAQNELEELRKSCTHQNYNVGYYSWRVGAMEVARICTDCDACLPGITPEEIEAFEATEQKRMDEWLVANGMEAGSLPSISVGLK
jgi:hypothetical protein